MRSPVLSVIALVLSVAVGESARAQGPAQPGAQNPASPPSPADRQEPYVVGRDDVTAPRVLNRVNPAYPPEAIRQRIEGVVRLRGIVERDGTINDVDVVQSLDAANGLDDAAVAALRQWRFEPGMVNGQPVRVMVTVSITFALTDTPQTQAWPQGFDGSGSAATVEEKAEAPGLRLTMMRPPDWTVRRDRTPREWLSLFNTDNFENVAINRAQPVSYELTWPVPGPLLQRVADGMREALPAASAAETVATGQIEARPGMFWVWSMLRVPTVPTPAGIAADANPFGEARVWLFSHTVNGEAVGVVCQVLLPRNLPQAELDARIQRAASDFRAIVQSIVIEKP